MAGIDDAVAGRGDAVEASGRGELAIGWSTEWCLAVCSEIAGHSGLRSLPFLQVKPAFGIAGHWLAEPRCRRSRLPFPTSRWDEGGQSLFFLIDVLSGRHCGKSQRYLRTRDRCQWDSLEGASEE